MRIICAAAFACVCLCANARADETVFASSFEPAWVLGYHVGYQSGMYPTDKIDFGALSHIVIGPVVPQVDGSLDISFDIGPVNGPAWATAVASAAHAANRK